MFPVENDITSVCATFDVFSMYPQRLIFRYFASKWECMIERSFNSEVTASTLLFYYTEKSKQIHCQKCGKSHFSYKMKMLQLQKLLDTYAQRKHFLRNRQKISRMWNNNLADQFPLRSRKCQLCTHEVTTCNSTAALTVSGKLREFYNHKNFKRFFST